MLFIASFFRVIPLVFTGDHDGSRPVTEEEQSAQRKIVNQVRRLYKRNSSDIGYSKLRSGRTISWLYMPGAIELRHPDGTRGWSLKHRSAMVVVTDLYFSQDSGQIGSLVKSYLVSTHGGNAYLTVHMVVHGIDDQSGSGSPLPGRRPEPTTRFNEQNDLFRPDPLELMELYYALVAIN